MLTLMLTMLTWAAQPVDCATARTWRPSDPSAAADLPRPPDDHKLERDPFALPGAATSANFAVRWGPDAELAEGEPEALLDLLEQAWTAEIDSLGYAPPIGSDTHLFNVYLGDTGAGSPSTLGAAGYYALDPDDLPMLVLDPGLLADDPDYLAMTVAHELYHALQAVTDRYAFEQGAVGSWYWEATATWASAQVYPDYPNHAEYLFGYALLHQEPVDTFDYFDGTTQGSLSEYYSYGAFLFPLDLVLATGDPDLIRDSWTDPSDEPDPLVVLDRLLTERGDDLDALWMRHNARMATWDHPLGQDYDRLVQAQFQYDEQRDRVVGRLTSPTEPGSPARPPGRLLPKRYGFNVYQVDLNEPSPARLRLQGTDGSEGTAATWHAELVTVSGETRTYTPLTPGDDGRLQTVVDPATYDEAWLVIGVTSQERSDAWTEETFSYGIDVQQPLEDDDPGGGCGCAQSGGAPGSLAGALVLLLWARRRRPC